MMEGSVWSKLIVWTWTLLLFLCRYFVTAVVLHYISSLNLFLSFTSMQEDPLVGWKIPKTSVLEMKIFEHFLKLMLNF